ncbi:MAG: hypothetical protein AAGF94_03305 [Pseudomonadota bacterium]
MQGLTWPDDYQEVLPLLKEQWGVGDQLYLSRMMGSGKSGALVYAVDVSSDTYTGQAILKLATAPDPKKQERIEAALHEKAIEDAPEFATAHLPKVINSLHHGEKLALLSTIAGRGLEYAQQWQECSFERQLKTVKRLSSDILSDWNANYSLSPGLLAPQDLLKAWCSYRLSPDTGGRIHTFLQDSCGITSETPSIMFNGHWFPNPIAFADRTIDLPERLQLRGVMGHLHGDLHGLNVLVEEEDIHDPDHTPEYYLIDLALYKSEQYLFYDHAYFEFATLLAARGNRSSDGWEQVIAQLRRFRHDRELDLKSDDLGLLELIRALRQGQQDWINENEADRLSYMESQELLARVGVGLNFVNKRMSEKQRRMAYLYAAANLKDYLKLNRIDWPKHGQNFVIATGPEESANGLPSTLEPERDALMPTTVTQQATAPTEAISEETPKKRSGRGFRVLAAACFVLAMSGLVVAAYLDYLDDLLAPFTTASSTETGNTVTDEIAAPVQKVSLAILPFEDLSDPSEPDLLQDLSTQLRQVFASAEAFQMPSERSISSIGETTEDPTEIGKALDVDFYLSGTFRVVFEDILLDVGLFKTEDGEELWSNQYRKQTDDTYIVQEDIAQAVADTLSLPIQIDSTALNPIETKNPKAYESYTRGIALLEQRGDALVRAMTALEYATDLEPDFAAAWAALSLTYNVAPTYLNQIRGQQVVPETYYIKSRSAALKARDIDPNLPIVQHALANMYQRDRQWSASERSYLRALGADPSNHRAMQDYGGLLQTVGKTDEAREYVNRAKQLDPTNDLYVFMSARLDHQISRSDEDMAIIKDTFVNVPQFRELAFRVIMADGSANQDLSVARSMVENCGNCTEEFRTSALEMIDAAGVDTGAQLFDKFRDEIFLSYQFLYHYGDVDAVLQAFSYNALQSNYRLQYFTVPWYLINAISDTEAFQQTIEDMGLVSYWESNGWPPGCGMSDSQFSCS